MSQEQIGLEQSDATEQSLATPVTTNYGEQPVSEAEGALAASAEEEKKDATILPEKGSQTYGKFASAETLLAAYNNLQSEFTKKCQKLSELEKQTSDNAVLEQGEQTPPPTPPAPFYEADNWNTKVANFLATQTDAKNYAAEISAEILNNASQFTAENALEQAWATVASKHFVPKEALSKDESFLRDYVFSNPDTKQKVLQLFFSEMEQSKPPLLMQSAGQQAFRTSATPKTMEEAKTMVHNMFL